MRTQKSAFLVLWCLFLCAGCAHRVPTINETYSLEESSGYFLLVPSIAPQSSNTDFQTSLIVLPGDKPIADPNFRQRCSINGPVFSLRPNNADKPNQWIVRSFNVQGWQKRGGDLDIKAEWNRFTRDLLLLERQSCFPRQHSFFAIRRAIAENIPLPASEAPLFFYSFGNTGFVDLAPGMQIKVERPLIQSNSATGLAGYKGSLVACRREFVTTDAARRV